jgi:hypothetical protein
MSMLKMWKSDEPCDRCGKITDEQAYVLTIRVPELVGGRKAQHSVVVHQSCIDKMKKRLTA